MSPDNCMQQYLPGTLLVSNSQHLPGYKKTVPAALFRQQEGAQGYLLMLRDIIEE